MERTHQSISARVNEFKDTGWIIDSGTRRKTRSGRAAIVWTPDDRPPSISSTGPGSRSS